MEALKRQRAVIKGSMTKLVTFARGNLDNVSIDEINIRLERAQRLLTEFMAIEREMFDEDSKVDSDLPEFEDNYYIAIAGLNASIRKHSISAMKHQTIDNSMNISQHSPMEVRLPKISIPTFDGNYMEWQSFFDMYTCTIHDKENLTGAQKFQYLRGLLKGEAASLIRHLAVTDANYHEAFQKLVQRYDRKRHTVNAFIKTYLEQPNITQPNVNNIRKLTDALDESLRGLKALGPNAEKRDPWLVHIALNKLDSETRSLWARDTADNDFPTIDELLVFLGRRIDMLDSCKDYSKKITPNRPATARAYTVVASSSTHCPLCKQTDHRIHDCGTYRSMTSEEKSAAVKENNRCYNCLYGGHRVQECRSKARCQHCRRKHHTSLHESSRDGIASNKIEIVDTNVNITTPIINGPEKISSEAEFKTYATIPASKRGILPTALIRIKDGQGEWQNCRALLDSASQVSFITETCMQNLNMKRTNARILVKGLGETGVGTTNGATELIIAANNNSTTLATQAFIIPKVAGTFCEFALSADDLRMLNGLQLADPTHNQRGHIDVLLGVEVFFKALQNGKLELPSGLRAIQTIFGWIVAGKPNTEQYESNSEVQNFNILLDIDKSLRRFWEIEEVPKFIKRTPDEQICEDLFTTTTKQSEDNRFVVKLPFKQTGSMLGTTYNAALNRLKSMERKFERDEEFGKMYRTFMAEYEALGHMVRLQGAQKYNKYYLPHHGVIKANSTTTKLRVVFDASTKSSTGLSLNDILMVGPTVQPPLINILIRFRQHKFVICGDIEKMYRQVWVSPDDQKYQNVLWRINPEKQPTTYELKTLTYGTAPAAFLATRTLQAIGIQIQPTQPEAARSILQDMYVDDIMTGASSIPQAKALVEQITNALRHHGFNLRKFLTNNNEIRSFIKNTTEKDVKDIGDHANSSTVLGIQWHPVEDVFQFTVNLPDRNLYTKRTLLSDASRIYDPLGWLSPIVIRVKILFQRLWMQSIGWDDELPFHILRAWMEIKGDLCDSNTIRIQRWVQTSNQVKLIGFCDASENAYAAVVYAVVNTINGVNSNLITSKSRVAPVKQISVPRLELMGALLLTKLMKSVEESLTVNITNVSLFTDSQIVLDWLSEHPRRWTTFVANRTSEIIQRYKREQWWHVTSKDNPADIASRGTNATELANNNLWWNGPQWLIDEETTKAIQTKGTRTRIKTTEELRPAQIDNFVVTSNDFIQNFINRYSSFSKMTKILALIRRYIGNLKNRQRKRETNRAEIDQAEHILIREIQQSHYAVEMNEMQNSGTLPKRSNLISLHPFIDDKGILRVGGRIQNSCVPFNTRHPIIIPMNHHVVKCLVRDAHILYNHPGVSLLTSIIRRRFWIIKGKILSRAIVHNCINCIKQSPKTQAQLMGNLPKERVQYIHPFYKVGVDYCGPFKVQPTRRRGQTPMKVYVCIFVCLSTKAVHIETVCNLTTDSYLGALNRFMSRRGSCHTIYSDNGTNFVGANNQLRELFQFLKSKASDITSALLQYKLEWKFIPPGSPHMGGIWEAAVKQAKIHLGRVVGNTILTLEEFTTLLTKIEAIMNSRPLAAIQSEDIDCLTPAHFLIGRTFTDVADEDLQHQYISPLAKWQIVKKMQQHFWNRWHRDYLTILQKRTKWVKEYDNISAGDIVLISEENLPSTCWGLARVIEVHKSSDGKVRIVSLRLANTSKIVQRAIHKLCKLPVRSYESTDSWPAEC